MRICLSCGRRAGDIPIRKLPLAMSPDLGLCVNCADVYERRGVQSGIQRESDRLLQDKTAFHPYMPKEMCRHCGEVPVLLDTQGRVPLWCAACERRRMQIATGVG